MSTQLVQATDPADVLALAAVAAQSAAGRSGVDIHLLHDMSGCEAVAALFREVWNTPENESPVSPDLLRALSHAGGYVAGAFADGRLVGASVAFHTAYGLHSHISGVRGSAQGRDVGFAMKQHQRAWALRSGLRSVTWTFDPLVRRNAWFNLVKLGAVGEDYLPEFYGAMNGVNEGDLSDRLFVRWDLDSPRAADAAAGRAAPAQEAALRAEGALLVLDEGADGGPVPGPDRDRAERVLLARVPADGVALRAADPALALSWRTALREVLAPGLARGRRLLGITRTGCYVLGPLPPHHREGTTP